MNNATLQPTYDQVYHDGSQSFYTVDSFDESLAISEMLGDVQCHRVLEIGCGEGRLAALLGMRGAERVDAVDYSAEAIERATQRYKLDNVTFSCLDYRQLAGSYDCIVLQGVLEHLDSPWDELHWLITSLLNPWGVLVTSSPCFLNPRGYIWMALQTLLEVPMSLTDLHFISPHDVQEFCWRHSLKMACKTIHHEWGHGDVTISDFKKRLHNALSDAKLPTHNVEEFLLWLRKVLPYEQPQQYNGATAIYRIEHDRHC